MNTTARLAAAALVAVVAVGGALYLLGPSRYGSGVAPSPSSTAVPTAAPSSAAAPSPTLGPIDTTTWTSYTSTRYGFSIGRPADWALKQTSRHDWTLAADHDFLTTASEGFASAGETIYVTAWSVTAPAGTSADAWILAYCQSGATRPCTNLQAASTPVTMDGHAGVLINTVDTEAFTLVGNRMYVVAVWESFDDPRGAPYGGIDRLLKGFVSTMHLLPGGPATPTPTARPSWPQSGNASGPRSASSEASFAWSSDGSHE